MSLISCHECHAEISSLAPACPKCGAPAKPPTPQPAPQPSTRPAFKIASGILALLTFATILAKCNSVHETPAPIATPAAPQKTEPPLPTPEEIAAQALEKKRDEALLRSALYIKRHLRNPDSLKIHVVRASEDGQIICIGYRAENGFGGMNVTEAVIVGTKISSARENVKKHCSSKTLSDYTDYTNQMLELSR